MEFNQGSELLEICSEKNIPISRVMKLRETEFSRISEEEVDEKMKKSLAIMRRSAKEPLTNPKPSVGGLIGGESGKLHRHAEAGKSVCGTVLQRAVTYAMAVLEVNASMGVIVAAPTAGSSGVVPGVLLSMRNASVAGAEAGCQAEVGAASAMAAAAAVEMMGGTPKQCLDAASVAMSNLLGLVCDPIAGLVEYPCQNRNSVGAANALICAEQTLAGIPALIPFDEMAQAMYHVGRSLPFELRESALGGCAATPAACRRTCEIFGG